jgi:TraY domain
MARRPRTHLRFRIESELLKRLERAREASGRTLTAEIAERLNKSFSDDAVREGLMDLRQQLIQMRAGLMDDIRRALDDLKMDLTPIDGEQQ